MSKDPAVLWYWNDWQGGTITLSRHLKGCYMDLLHAQFNQGNLSLDEIKTVLGSDFGSAWSTLQKKFKTDDKGLYFNERLITEQNKRGAYTQSRRENATTNEHMLSHMEDEIENEYKDVFSKWITYKKNRREKYKTPESLLMAYKKLFKISNGDYLVAEEIIDDAIANNYSGFFALKGNKLPEKKESKASQNIKALQEIHRTILSNESDTAE